jgi:hypothetical protein
MKVKMYGYAWKSYDGSDDGFEAYHDEERRDIGYKTDQEDGVKLGNKFTFVLDIDPAALFPPDPEFAADAVEATS